jgi:hypothetical protein
MTLAEALASFRDYLSNQSSTVASPNKSPASEQATRLLTEYFSPGLQLNEMTSLRVRDFLARWYLEKVCTSKEDVPVPSPQEVINYLSEFFGWAHEYTDDELAATYATLLTELSETLPRASAITRTLSEWIRQRRGAFAFPEFLTSFEDGGHSEYDIDTPGSIGALEGFFRIVRVQGALIEAEDLISQERVWPIIFPVEVAALVDRPYVINLELVRTEQGWEITDCGFAYPPGTEV